ncbi:GAF domain-containing protein [Synechococcus sp. PCC 7502]|uniref:GAF domain-containing protein n=1 Tax=Synechococcus sp. PCC 7502 TaxID=1173263 RepID=UPI00029FE30E|nr:GAF domain-containing protein [Synechococcus sp. PCC 7502]AFY73244.1 GAF domain-containing protein [Synechococcus sp. PCC 7502]
MIDQTEANLRAEQIIETEGVKLIDNLLAIGNALSTRTDLQDILNLILLKAREITYSDAGSFYLIDHRLPHPAICFEVSQNSSQPERSLVDFAVPMTKQTLVGYVAITGEVLNIPNVYEIPTDAPYHHHHAFDEDISYRACSVVVLPMKNAEGLVFGVMQLINRKLSPDIILTPDNALAMTQPYSIWEEKILRSLVSQATLFVEHYRLLNPESSIH